jgi:hypothetical protein
VGHAAHTRDEEYMENFSCNIGMDGRMTLKSIEFEVVD